MQASYRFFINGLGGRSEPVHRDGRRGVIYRNTGYGDLVCGHGRQLLLCS